MHEHDGSGTVDAAGSSGRIWPQTNCFDLSPPASSFHLAALCLHREENAGNSGEA